MMTVSIILDTDMDTDCDDVGALAVLHALADQDEARILGVVFNALTSTGPSCIATINRYYGRSDLPIGAIRSDEGTADSRHELYRRYVKHVEDTQPFVFYNRFVGQESPLLGGNGAEVWDSVALYRKLLAGQPDRSVVIVAVGFLTALEYLMDSGPDEYTPLDGMDLVRAKVKMLVTMGGGSFPEGRDSFNWWMDKRAAARVLNHWPTALAVSEWGETILTGAALSSQTPETNPVRRSYELYLGGPGKSRSSWDQVAVLYGVRGARDYFTEIDGYRIRFSPDTGEHQWLPETGQEIQAPHLYLRQAAPDKALAETIEGLMVRPPKART